MKNFLWKRLFAGIFLLLLATGTSFAAYGDLQQSGRTVTCVVSDNAGPVIGAYVVVRGTMNGGSTDADGRVVLNNVPDNTTLVVTYLGYVTQEIALMNNQTFVEIILQEDAQALEEVVVVGYGVQKKKLVTGATVQVSGDDIAKLNTISPFTALQSQAPGVTIVQNNGQPGSGFKVTIRGLGTIGASSPLYVIDGVVGGNLDNINPNDIESIDVLKDAASAAIYGSRAANGVILVTTKQGKLGKTTVTYDGFYGQQFLAKTPDLLTAQEYMIIQDEVRFNEGNPAYDWANLLPADLYQSVMNGSWKGTNWFKEAYNEGAPTQNHAVGVTGGSDLSKFSLGFSYSGSEGILGKPVHAQFERYTARINSEHVILKGRDFDIIKFGETLYYTYTSNNGVATGNIYWNAIHNLLVANPLLPVTNADGDWFNYYDKQDTGWKFDGNAGNPIGAFSNNGQGLNQSKSYSLRTTAYLEIQPIKNLVFRSQFGYNMSASNYRSYTAISAWSNNARTSIDNVSQSGSMGHDWKLDNTLSYSFNLTDNQFDIIIGQTAEKWGMGQNISASGSNSIFPGYINPTTDIRSVMNYAWVDNTKPTELSQRGAGGSVWGEGAIASFFGRINYNYKEKYMATVIFRADGSSNFARGKRWGYFPSASVGWTISNEDFMAGASDIIDFLKIRASWGQNGNCSIANFQYLSTIAFDVSNGYYFASDKKTQTVGGYADILANPDVSWETSEQLNIGLDARFARGRLGLAFDWYQKMTRDWLLTAPIPAVYGLNAPAVNGGDVMNTGVELALNWDDFVGDFRYGISLNGSYNKNEVTRIANTEGIIHGAANVLSQGTTEMYRAEVGYPLGYFYGYKTAGVFQNWDQVNNTAAKYDSAKPGDLIFVDTNGDGAITEDDRTMIGSGHPDILLGFNLYFAWKGLDFSITGAGAFGQEIAKSYRSFADSPLQNFTTDIFGRWTGEGTSNKLPRLTSGTNINWQNISDIYIEKGDYVKIQNVQIGYDFKQAFRKLPFGQVRLYVSAQNVYTFTNYSGLDPEIGYGYDQGWVQGIDLGYYPSPRTYMVGLNLKF